MANQTKQELQAALKAIEIEEKKAQRQAVVNAPKENDVIAEFGGKAPLKRDRKDGQPFPVSTLGETMIGLVDAGCRRLDCSEGLIAQSALAAVAVAVQGLYNVRSPDNRQTSCNEFFFTVADSGRGKSEAMDIAMKGHELFKAKLRKEWSEWVERKEEFEDDPENKGLKFDEEEPWRGLYILEEPTFESLTNSLKKQPIVGLVTDEAGRMLNGYSMSGDQAVKTAAGLCDMWSSKKPIRRSRVSEGETELYHRRVSIHFLIQERIALTSFLSSETMKNQGFIPRFLMCAPKEPEYRPMAGRTFGDYQDIDNKINNFANIIYTLLERMTMSSNYELRVTPIDIDEDAFYEWCRFKDEIMIDLQNKRRYTDIEETALRMPEHCQRLALILQVVEHPGLLSISKPFMKNAITLSRYYLSEAERLLDNTAQSKYERSLMDSAEKLLNWLHSSAAQPHYVDGLMPHVAIYRFGPSGVRSANAAMKACTVLVNHGHLQMHKKNRSKLWELAV